MSKQNRIYPSRGYEISLLGTKDEGRILSPDFYRYKLSPDERILYNTVVNGIASHSNSIDLNDRTVSVASIRRAVRAIHLDHPELFWVNYWRYQICDSLLYGKSIRFEMFLDRNISNSVTNTLTYKRESLKQRVLEGKPSETIYHLIIREIIRSTKYLNTGDAFRDHTIAGPILNHTGVCEGISKLFLFYCQALDVPCAIVNGTLNGMPHGWNMVEINGEINYIDITGLVGKPINLGVAFKTYYKNRNQMQRQGYRWEECV